MKEPNYWGYRIDTRARDFFNSELEEGRLRQGWGWDSRQDLNNMVLDEGAGRNRFMLERVKKGDILLVPRLPNWDKVIIVEATKDWDKGYYFEIAEGQTDYGHVFPAKKLRSFIRNSPVLKGRIRSTLGNPSRFWSLTYCADEIDEILNAKEEESQIIQKFEERKEEFVKVF